MARTLTVSVDAMGGDAGPGAVVSALLRSALRHPDVHFLLHGDEAQLNALLARHSRLKDKVKVHHAPGRVAMEDKPSHVLRRGRDTSMWHCIRSVKTGEADVAVSAGNTGALMAVSMFNLGIIEGVSTTFNAQQRTLGYQDAMKTVGATVVGVQSGQWEIDKANAVATGMLREHPDLKALLCGNDSMALGTVAAVKAAGKTGKVLVVGYDNIGAIKPMLLDGRVLATADQFGAKQAVFGIETALKALAAKQHQADMPAMVKTDVVLVTKGTVK